MGTVAKVSGNGTSTPVPAGNHLAVCVGVIDLGHQYNEEYDKWTHKILIQWELPDETMSDGRPMMVSRQFSLSLHEKSALRPLLESWRGRAFTEEEAAGFEVANLLGKPCMLNVIHEKKAGGGFFAKVQTATPLSKRTTAPEPSNPLRHYSLEDGPPPDDFPDWIKQKIAESQEAKDAANNEAAINSAPAPATVDDDDPPF